MSCAPGKQESRELTATLSSAIAFEKQCNGLTLTKAMTVSFVCEEGSKGPLAKDIREEDPARVARVTAKRHYGKVKVGYYSFLSKGTSLTYKSNTQTRQPPNQPTASASLNLLTLRATANQRSTTSTCRKSKLQTTTAASSPEPVYPSSFSQLVAAVAFKLAWSPPLPETRRNHWSLAWQR